MEQTPFLTPNLPTPKLHLMSFGCNCLRCCPAKESFRVAINFLMDTLSKDVDKESVSQIHQLLHLYQQWLKLQSTCLSNGDHLFHQKIVYSMAKICYWKNITDSALVADVIRSIYQCDGHFRGIYEQEIICPSLVDPVWRWSCRSDARSASYNFSKDTPIAYFLDHATRQKLTFKDGKRFADVNVIYRGNHSPSVFAVICFKPQLLLLLLRYGAQLTPMFPQYGQSPGNLDVGLSVLLVTCLRRVQVEAVMSAGDPSDLRIQCANIILRVVPQLQLKSLHSVLKHMKCSNPDAEDFVEKMSVVVPQMKKRYQQPSELKHLCRCAVREQLKDCWQLPFGIAELHVPGELKRYLDLFED